MVLDPLGSSRAGFHRVSVLYVVNEQFEVDIIYDLALYCIGRSHMVQRTVEPATSSSSAEVQQSVFASVDSIVAFKVAEAREQEFSRPQVPQLAELQISSPTAGKTFAASKKKLMSMAFEAQRQRREAVAAAVAAAAAEAVVSNSGNDLSSNTDKPSAEDGTSSGADFHPVVDKSCTPKHRDTAEQCDTASASATEPCGSHNELLAADDAESASVVARSSGAAAVAPKTLTPAKTLPASLVTATADPGDGGHSITTLSSPMKLVPPADPQRIHAIVAADVPTTGSDSEATKPDTVSTVEQ